jgi:Ca-activated chloride channel family protein|tara:strand:- start:7698 stop:8825 length:1128 start_codon:yes stop_codon:yes gene_type:complete
MQPKKTTYSMKKALTWVLGAEVIFWLVYVLVINAIHQSFPNEFYFRYPKALWLNVIVFLLYFILFNQRKQLHSILDIAPKRLLNSFIKFTPDKQYWQKWIVFRFAFLFLTIALAQPLFGSKKAMSISKNSEVVLALDVSNSMNTKDIDKDLSRLDIAKRATIQLINGLKGERLGVLIFAGNAFVQLPVTKDYNSAKLFVNEIETKMISNQGTNFQVAIEKAVGMFSEGDAGKAILMVTDGENHEKIPDQILAELPDKNIFLAVVGLGTKNGGLVPKDPDRPYAGYKTDERGQPVLSKMDGKLVKEIAQKAKGIAVISDNPFPNLSDLLTEINGLNKGNLRDLNLDIKDAYYHWPLVIGIFLWIFATVMPFYRKNG